jgi:nucleotide-binding universal stress UspA family protein
MNATPNTSNQSSPVPAGGYRVLVPYDGSDIARHALDFVDQLPVRHLTILHVIPASHLIVPPLTPAEQEAWLAEVTPDMQQLADKLKANGQDVSVDIRSGDIATEIIDAGKEHDLIVMTTTGKGAAGRMLFGNVADRVSRGSHTPTVLLRGNLVSGGTRKVDRLVVPLDGSELSEQALPVAARLSAQTGLPVQLVRVTDFDTVLYTARRLRQQGQAIPYGEDRYDQALHEATQEAEAYLTAKAGNMQQSGVTAETRCLRGTPVHTLLDSLDAGDLVVMTSHGQRGYKRWLLGSVAEKLVREAKAPVMLVPTRPAF